MADVGPVAASGFGAGRRRLLAVDGEATVHALDALLIGWSASLHCRVADGAGAIAAWGAASRLE